MDLNVLVAGQEILEQIPPKNQWIFIRVKNKIKALS